MDVLISRVIGEEPTPGKTFGSRGHGIVLILEGLTPNHWDQEGSANLLGQPPPDLQHLGWQLALPPPVRCAQKVGPPSQPYLIVFIDGSSGMPIIFSLPA